jgi:hypothetical protein
MSPVVMFDGKNRVRFSYCMLAEGSKVLSPASVLIMSVESLPY